jgi:hypothetical protein
VLDALIAPTFATDSDVSVVAADFDLLTDGDDVAVGVDTRVDDSLSAA